VDARVHMPLPPAAYSCLACTTSPHCPNPLRVLQVLQEAVDADERVVPWDELDDEAKDLVRGWGAGGACWSEVQQGGFPKSSP